MEGLMQAGEIPAFHPGMRNASHMYCTGHGRSSYWFPTFPIGIALAQALHEDSESDYDDLHSASHESGPSDDQSAGFEVTGSNIKTLQASQNMAAVSPAISRPLRGSRQTADGASGTSTSITRQETTSVPAFAPFTKRRRHIDTASNANSSQTNPLDYEVDGTDGHPLNQARISCVPLGSAASRADHQRSPRQHA